MICEVWHFFLLEISSFLTHWRCTEYNEAEDLFDELRTMNPYRLDDMDVFSNLLFVKDSKEKLSVLAHQSERIDKYRPETCCIIGN
jgi:anaphase-promoting complex subunit 8